MLIDCCEGICGWMLWKWGMQRGRLKIGKMKTKLLFLCSANIDRSPCAEYLFQNSKTDIPVCCFIEGWYNSVVIWSK